MKIETNFIIKNEKESDTNHIDDPAQWKKKHYINFFNNSAVK